MTDRQRVLAAVRDLPENASLEDAIERLCFLAKVGKGLRELDAGQAQTHDDAKRRLAGG
jgi:predicted transcriptional regulator